MAFDIFWRFFNQRCALRQNGDAFRQREDHMHIMLDDGNGDVTRVADLLEKIDGELYV